MPITAVYLGLSYSINCSFVNGSLISEVQFAKIDFWGSLVPGFDVGILATVWEDFSPRSK